MVDSNSLTALRSWALISSIEALLNTHYRSSSEGEDFSPPPPKPGRGTKRRASPAPVMRVVKKAKLAPVAQPSAKNMLAELSDYDEDEDEDFMPQSENGQESNARDSSGSDDGESEDEGSGHEETAEEQPSEEVEEKLDVEVVGTPDAEASKVLKVPTYLQQPQLTTPIYTTEFNNLIDHRTVRCARTKTRMEKVSAQARAAKEMYTALKQERDAAKKRFTELREGTASLRERLDGVYNALADLFSDMHEKHAPTADSSCGGKDKPRLMAAKIPFFLQTLADSPQVVVDSVVNGVPSVAARKSAPLQQNGC
ncbi:hypothetical protein DFJ77DRAFT_467399 [Powellomyces hirtus]|nr:hypothetical protein DFJ77DRAFT_467399 [Powellomyces hirtus]